MIRKIIWTADNEHELHIKKRSLFRDLKYTMKDAIEYEHTDTTREQDITLGRSILKNLDNVLNELEYFYKRKSKLGGEQ